MKLQYLSTKVEQVLRVNTFAGILPIKKAEPIIYFVCKMNNDLSSLSNE